MTVGTQTHRGGWTLDEPEYRLEGREKVTGTARFAADHRVENALQVAILRSPYPHARLVSVNAAAARRMPGVHAVLTGADIRPRRAGRRLQDWPLLAWDRVRLVGDRIAAVAAESVETARAAVRSIDVEYELLPAVFDPATALLPSAPVLHPHSADYLFLGGTRSAVPHPNIQGRVVHEHGDVEGGFACAAHIFTHEFEIPRTFTGYLEPRASVVFSEGSTYRVVSTNKSPFMLREQMSAGLGLPLEQLVIDSGYIGGDFGGKGFSVDEYMLVLLARATGRPVRVVLGYSEDMTSTNTRHGARIRLRTATDPDGRFLAHDGYVLFDGGAYAAAKPSMVLLPGEGLATLAGYHLPSARVEALTVYTNTVPAGQARAPGQAQNSFAAESHIDLIATGLGLDPLELRRRNALRPGDLDVLGEKWQRSAMISVLEQLTPPSSVPRPAKSGHLARGRGVALGCRPSPAGKLGATVQLTVTAEAQLHILTGCADQGGGALTMMQRVAAQELGLPLSRIEVTRAATDEALFDLGAGGSRITPVVGGAVLAGARQLRLQLDLLVPGLPLEEQLDHCPGLSVVGEYQHPDGVHGCYAYEVGVQVDRETGDFEITDCRLVADVGAVINPVALRGQLVGGFATGIGQAMTEEYIVRDGLVQTSNLNTYTLPTMADVPPLSIVLVTDDPGGGPFGAKSAGELSNPAIAPAIANAIADAVGVRIISLPITPEKIYRALHT